VLQKRKLRLGVDEIQKKLKTDGTELVEKGVKPEKSIYYCMLGSRF